MLFVTFPLLQEKRQTFDELHYNSFVASYTNHQDLPHQNYYPRRFPPLLVSDFFQSEVILQSPSQILRQFESAAGIRNGPLSTI